MLAVGRSLVRLNHWEVETAETVNLFTMIPSVNDAGTNLIMLYVIVISGTMVLQLFGFLVVGLVSMIRTGAVGTAKRSRVILGDVQWLLLKHKFFIMTLIVITVGMQVVGAALTENDLMAVDKITAAFKNKDFTFTRATGGKHWQEFQLFKEMFEAAVGDVSRRVANIRGSCKGDFTVLDILTTKNKIPEDFIGWDTVIYSALLFLVKGVAVSKIRRSGKGSGRKSWKLLGKFMTKSNLFSLANTQAKVCTFTLPKGHPGAALDDFRDRLNQLSEYGLGLPMVNVCNILVNAINTNSLYRSLSTTLNKPEEESESESEEDSDEEDPDSVYVFETPNRVPIAPSGDEEAPMTAARVQEMFKL